MTSYYRFLISGSRCFIQWPFSCYQISLYKVFWYMRDILLASAMPLFRRCNETEYMIERYFCYLTTIEISNYFFWFYCYINKPRRFSHILHIHRSCFFLALYNIYFKAQSIAFMLIEAQWNFSFLWRNGALLAPKDNFHRHISSA